MAPLTRSRSTQPGDVPGALMQTYYSQRASEGGLIIGEVTTVSPSARGWFCAPGLYSDAQVAGWKAVTDAVHAKGGKMFAELWHTGRSSHVDVTGGLQPVLASVNPVYWQDTSHLTSTPDGWVTPSPHRALETGEIAGIVEDYRRAAERAKTAGFDGAELHGANGYFVDQFLQDGSNKRTDAYGGSIENRAGLLLEIVQAMAAVFGGDRTAVRIGPNGRWNGIGDSDPRALFDHVAQELMHTSKSGWEAVGPRSSQPPGSEFEMDRSSGQRPVRHRRLWGVVQSGSLGD